MQGMEELRNEVQVYSVCRHEHLLPLLGYCFEPEARCLVYPLMEGGNLEDAILRPARGASGASAGEPVDWRARVRWLRRERDLAARLSLPLPNTIQDLQQPQEPRQTPTRQKNGPRS